MSERTQECVMFDFKFALNELKKQVEDTGRTNVEVQFWIDADGAHTFYIRYRLLGENQTKFFHVEPNKADFERWYDHFSMAHKGIEEWKTVRDQQRDEVLHALGKLIDKARAADIEVEFLNPLVETMQQLSENVIEHRK